MSSCSCSPDALSSVTFGNGTVLVRCPAHEAQHWLVDGRPVEVTVALGRLRALFTEHRSRASREPALRQPALRQAAPRPRVIQLPQPAPAGSPVRVDDEALTALLHARGLSGSWAVA